MRIVGGRDYYDSGLAYGQDDDVIFVRTGRTLTKLEVPALPLTAGAAPAIVASDKDPGIFERADWSYTPVRWSHRGTSYQVDAVRAIFCGRYYGGVRISWVDRLPGSSPIYCQQWREPFVNGRPINSETFWDQNSLGKWLAGRGARASTAKWNALRPLQRKPFERFVLERAALETLLEHRITVATLVGRQTQRGKYRPSDRHESDIEYWQVDSDNLKGLDFIKLVDPMAAFQEIAMWVGGVLPRPGRPMVEITDDNVKLAKHGMDRWSFRKMSEKSK